MLGHLRGGGPFDSECRAEQKISNLKVLNLEFMNFQENMSPTIKTS